MSGPVREQDVDRADVDTADVDRTEDEGAGVEVREGRRTALPGLEIVRVLPTRGLRTVGAWCFVDCMLPPDAVDPDPMEIGPHPHIGLSTATWLFAGEAVHGDSLGTEQLIRPGQLNLMTAGHGIAHAELGLGAGLRGVQMWIAQPEATRHAAPDFTHHAELPQIELHGSGDGSGGARGDATVFMGSLGGGASPARQDTPLVGAELRMGGGVVELEVDPGFEHAVVPLDGPVLVEGVVVQPGALGHVAPGRASLALDGGDGGGGRVMLLGGEPFEPVLMWWNFVGRTKEEITLAWSDWQDHDTDRFPEVPSDLARIDAPAPPWARAGGSRRDRG